MNSSLLSIVPSAWRLARLSGRHRCMTSWSRLPHIATSSNWIHLTRSNWASRVRPSTFSSLSPILSMDKAREAKSRPEPGTNKPSTTSKRCSLRSQREATRGIRGTGRTSSSAGARRQSWSTVLRSKKIWSHLRSRFMIARARTRIPRNYRHQKERQISKNHYE